MSDAFDFEGNRTFEPITSFKGKYRFLSNFWACNVVLDGVTYQDL